MESPGHLSSPESFHNGDGPQSTRKRKRKTFSCDTCRKRKLKCDRELPICGRCQKSGNAASCVYEHPPESTAKHGTTSSMLDQRMSLGHIAPGFPSPSFVTQAPHPNHAAERIAALESRIARIDPTLTRSIQSHKQPRLNHDINHEPNQGITGDSKAISFYGAGFKTGFFGPSSERNASSYYPAIVKLVSAFCNLHRCAQTDQQQFPELKSFGAFVSFNNLQHPLLAQVRTHIYAIRKNSKLAKKLLPLAPAITPLDAIPVKDTCVKMVSLYWDSIASTYHVFHAPTFWPAFYSYWTDGSQRTESMACTILLMMSCVHCSAQTEPPKYRGLSNVAREQASYWIDTCELWMTRQSRKHLTIESYQHRILLVLAKQINAIKRKQIWERASELFAFAISTGLHQDPTKIDNTYGRDQGQNGSTKSKTNLYEREMRRRLWATIVEMEMQASIDQGVPSSRLALLADCGPPTLLSDDTFNSTSSNLPPSSGRSSYAATSYLHLSYESVRLRSSLTDLINTGLEHLTYDEILGYDEQIKKAIDHLPLWVNVDANSPGSSASDSASAAALLQLQLLQFQLLIHIPSARQDEQSPRANLSRMTCIETSFRILDIHLRLAQPQRGALRCHWLSLLREDIFRSVIGICYNLVLWRGVNAGLTSSWMKSLYIDRASQGLDHFKQKVFTLGDHYVQMWYILAAVGMLRASFDLEDINKHITDVANDLTGIFGDVCSSQEEPSNEQTAAGALTALATPSSGGLESGTPLQLPDMNTAFLDGVDMNSWGFDDLWPFSSTGLSW